MKQKKIIKTVDGNEACAYSSYALSEVAAIYPITPSSNMAEHIDAWACQNKRNIFDNKVKVVEMQSEAGAAGAVHGALQAGTLATTYTASQGLLLMIPNIYKMVGEMLPGVFHVASRSIATRALSIFGDHQDIYATRQTGVSLLCASNVQEVADFTLIAHLSAIKSSSPFIHFFDGFRTSHEIQKIELTSYDKIKELIDYEALKKHRDNALNPHGNALTRGGAENDDIYFQAREAQNKHFEKIIEDTKYYFKKISKLTKRKYNIFDYYGDKEATKIIVAMGSVCETIKEVIDYENKKGNKLGLIIVRLYRPFAKKDFLNTIPSSVKKVAVLDRTKESGASGEPLYLDVVETLSSSNKNIDVLVGGRYGLSSKDTTPSQIKAVYDNLDKKKPINSFTIGINDDVTHLSLKEKKNYKIKNNHFSALFYGMGSDGTVSANKNTIKIIGDYTNKYVQAYFAYDSKKAGSVTRSHLRFSNNPIRSTYYIDNADFISCSMHSYIIRYDVLKNIKKGGIFLLNTHLSKEEIVNHLPNRFKKQLAEKNVKFYIINADKIANNIGMKRRTNTILQSAFFKLNPLLMEYTKAKKLMKQMAKTSYMKSGIDIVKANYLAIDKGEQVERVYVDPNWKSLPINKTNKTNKEDYFNEFVSPMFNLEGNDLPVSTFTKYGLLDGSLQNNMAIKDNRKTAIEVPTWIKENCIQCNKCVFVCPHATIRAFLLDGTEVELAPNIVKENLLDAIGGPNIRGLKYRIQVDPLNCVGCNLCVKECPGKGGNKALTMNKIELEEKQKEASEYLFNNVTYKTHFFPLSTVKGIGFAKPYFEASGACAGCGETPYYKLLSQLFGEDLLIANATGCSSIYSASTPYTPFVKDKNNNGVAWANSLFEDNAEYGFGMRIAEKYKEEMILQIIDENLDKVESPLKEQLQEYLNIKGNKEKEKVVVPKLISLVEKSSNLEIKKLLTYKNDLRAKSLWIVGGDGWAYDIGYGGLDHVLASNENVNILVLDSEVYSNTGGQSSKASQTASIAKFTADGKKTAKKDLAAMALMYKDVYVAQISLGANNMQAIKALKEAESYNGPSLVIAYSPCAEHGIKGGLVNHQESQKKATECGYFNIFRYDPRLSKPLQIDFKEPNFDKFIDFLTSETRFNRLKIKNPENADFLFEKAKEEAIKRFKFLKLMENIEN